MERKKEIINAKKAKALYSKGEDRLEYKDNYGKWQIFDHKFDRASIFKFYDEWRIY